MTSGDYSKIIGLKVNGITIKKIDVIEPKEACTCSTTLVIEKKIRAFR